MVAWELLSLGGSAGGILEHPGRHCVNGGGERHPPWGRAKPRSTHDGGVRRCLPSPRPNHQVREVALRCGILGEVIGLQGVLWGGLSGSESMWSILGFMASDRASPVTEQLAPIDTFGRATLIIFMLGTSSLAELVVHRGVRSGGCRARLPELPGTARCRAPNNVGPLQGTYVGPCVQRPLGNAGRPCDGP